MNRIYGCSSHNLFIWMEHVNLYLYCLLVWMESVNVFFIVFIWMESMHVYSVVCLYKWNFRMFSSPYTDWICEWFLYCLFFEWNLCMFVLSFVYINGIFGCFLRRLLMRIEYVNDFFIACLYEWNLWTFL
jgi:hypothetical protein